MLKSDSRQSATTRLSNQRYEHDVSLVTLKSCGIAHAQVVLFDHLWSEFLLDQAINVSCLLLTQ
ncbi:hypothetical protein AN936_13195 [Sphingopyxis macrogoltabida]|uniref:Uncharacterized protein n=1 Tax=Sphingopyxis macrogoltabida TaxID=33050 RepID=A0A0N9UWI2_SPHMC|nr:hypothetical protein AN936_13195 [Sphingopyxis macrogoltabida]